MNPVEWHDRGHAWHVIINNPPVNATSTAVRQGLHDAVIAINQHHQNAQDDAQNDVKKAVVLTCAGRSFIAGGDITEFDAPPQEPHLPDVCQMIEDAPLPWIAVMHGHVLGGGLEIAMCASFRLAHPKTQFGMSEVKVGLIPGAGGSQRLPRLVGLDLAIPMLTQGKIIKADEFMTHGGCDAILDADDDLLEAGLDFAQNLPKRPSPISSRSLSDNGDTLAKAEADLKAKSRGEIAPLANLEAIKLATNTDFSDGQPEERRRHLEMRNSPQSRALCHAFLSERKVSKPSIISGHSPSDVKNVTVVGGGLMGAGIAFACLLSGHHVTIIERDGEAVNSAHSRIADLKDVALKRGKLNDKSAADLMARFSVSSDYQDAANSDLAIEAVFEDIAVKREVFNNLHRVVSKDALLATNTSYLDPHDIMDGISNPSRLLGLHFFSPAHIMKLVEVISLNQTSPEVLATGFAFAKSLGKVAVLSGVCDGFIGNRIMAAYRRQADYMLLDGATPSQIDTAMRNFGMPMGPYEQQDLSGLQIAWANRKRQAGTRPIDERYVTIGDQLCGSERFGQRSGKGWYRYDGRTPEEDPEVIKIIEDTAAELSITRQDFSQDDIQSRLMAVMINEGALIVEEGIAERDLDVDMVKIFGYGFPRWRGGPMHYGQEIGADSIKKSMATVIAQSPNSWRLADRFQ